MDLASDHAARGTQGTHGCFTMAERKGSRAALAGDGRREKKKK